jgi:hypothetical protein
VAHELAMGLERRFGATGVRVMKSPSDIIVIDFARQFPALRSDHPLRLSDYQVQSDDA